MIDNGGMFYLYSMRVERNAGGRTYILSQEKRLSYNGREVLYFIGCAVVDASCCGPGGCSYALVPGYVKQWKYRLTPENLPVTQVEPIGNKDVQKALQRLIKKKDPVQQVDFE
jgi:hypothetical protein